MTNTILIKRSSVAGKIPTTSAVSVGELAINTYDGRLYTNINNGASTIVMLGGSYSYTGDLTATIINTTTLSLTLNAITTAGTYSNVVVNAKGLITSGSTLTWANLGYTPVNKAGDTMAGALIISQTTGGQHLLDSPSAGQYRALGYTTGGLNRWNIGADNSAESGSNVGSNLYLTRYSDAGSVLGTVMAVTRSTGAMNIYNGLTVTNGASADSLMVTGTLVATAFQGSFVGSVGAAVAWASPMTLAHIGDVTGVGSFTGASATTIAMTLAASGVTAGTYNNLTVNSKGIVTYGTLSSVVLSGDIGGAGTSTILSSYVAGIIPYSTSQNTIPFSLPIAIASNGSQFCVISNNASFSCAISSDGLNWTTGILPTITGSWQSVTYNNVSSLYCAIATNSNAAATSSNGLSWTSQTLPASLVWYSVASNGSILCALNYGGNQAAISTNGSTWTQQTLPASLGWYSVTSNGSIFCAVAYNSSVAATSPNGITWTQQTLPASLGWSSIASNGSIFCAVALGTSLAATSTNGVSWNLTTLPATLNWIAVSSVGSMFCAVAENLPINGLKTNLVATSPDGINWTSRYLSNYNIVSMASNNTAFCAVTQGASPTSIRIVPYASNSALRLSTPITIAHSGAIAGSSLFDGSQSITIATTLAPISGGLVTPNGGTTSNSLAAWLGNINGNPKTWVQTTTVYNLVSAMIGTYPVSSQFGGGTVQYQSAICGAVNVPSTDTGGNANTGVSGYGLSSSTLTGAVGLFGMGACAANNVSAWGGNFLITNSSTQGAPPGTGNNNCVLYGLEIDFNVVTSSLYATLNVPTRGIYFIGGGNVQPIGGFYAMDVASPGFTMSPTIKFDSALHIEDASCTSAIDIGCTGTGAGVGSQNLIMRGRTPGSVAVNTSIACDPYGNLVLTPNSGGLISLANIAAGISLNTAGSGSTAGSQVLQFNGISSGTISTTVLEQDATGDFIINAPGTVNLQTAGTTRLQVLPWAVGISLPLSVTNSMTITGGLNITGGGLTVVGALSASTFAGALIGNASTATAWSSAMTLATSGDITGIGSFTGATATTISMTLAASGVTAGTYTRVTVNAKGLVTSASKTYPIPPTYGTIVGTASTGTITLSTTLPVSTIGTTLWTATYTPSTTTSVIELDGCFIWDSPTANSILTGVIFRGTTCVGAVSQTHANGTTNLPDIMSWNFMDSPATTSPIVYTMRVGLSVAGAWYAGKTTSYNLGGALGNNIYVIQEYVS